MIDNSETNRLAASTLLPTNTHKTILHQASDLESLFDKHEGVGQSYQSSDYAKASLQTQRSARSAIANVNKSFAAASDLDELIETQEQRLIDPTIQHSATDYQAKDWLTGKPNRRALSNTSKATDPVTGEPLGDSYNTNAIPNPISTEVGTDPDGDGIFGRDNRKRVSNTTSFPFSAVVRIEATWSGADGRLGTSDDINTTASGALISDFHVLTSGHVIHSKRRGGWADSIEVIAGSKGKRFFDESLDTTRADNEYYGRAKATYKRSYKGWTDSADFDYDIGLITLDRSLGKYTDVFDYGPSSANANSNVTWANVAGYPSDLFDANQDGTRDNFDMIQQYGKVTSKTQFAYRSTDLDLIGGNSGGPLWTYTGKNKRTLYGVSSNTRINRETNAGIYNEFTAITWKRAQDLKRWIKEDYAARKPTDRPDFVDYDRWFNTDYAYARNNTTGGKYTVRAGDSFTARAVIRNNGTQSYGGSSKGFFLVPPSIKVSFYASTNKTITGSDYKIGETFLSAIDPFKWKDAIWTGRFPTLRKGRYFLGWKIDDSNSYSEFSEGNNTGLLKQIITVV